MASRIFPSVHICFSSSAQALDLANLPAARLQKTRNELVQVRKLDWRARRNYPDDESAIEHTHTRIFFFIEPLDIPIKKSKRTCKYIYIKFAVTSWKRIFFIRSSKLPFFDGHLNEQTNERFMPGIGRINCAVYRLCKYIYTQESIDCCSS